MVLHKDVALGNMHPPYNFVYADAAARLAATGFVPDDIGKLALQEDDATLWILKDDSPETWGPVGEAAAAGSEGDLQLNFSGALGASAVGLNWTEGADETDSTLTVQGTIIGYAALIANVIGAHHIQSAGAELNIQLSDEIQINMDAGTDGQVLTTHGVGAPPTWEDSTGGSGSPGGGDTQLQYNDGGSFDGISTLTWNGSALDIDSGLTLSTDAGSAGEVLTSGGPATVPTWTTLPTGFTAEDARDTIGTALVAGNNIDITVSDAGDTITIDVEALTSADLSDFTEATQDAIATSAGAGFLVDTSSVAWTYVDATPSLTLNVKDEYVRDTIATALTTGTNIALTANDGADTISADLTTAAKKFTINYEINGGGSAISTGIKGDFKIDPDCTIIAWEVVADVSGAIVIDLWQDTYANFPPVAGDSMTTSEKPTITASGTKAQDTSLNSAAGWDAGGGRWIRVNVDSCSTITRATLALTCVRD